METFAHYYCFSKKQRPGLVMPPKKDKSIGEEEIGDPIEIGDSITPLIESESLNTITPDDDDIL